MDPNTSFVNYGCELGEWSLGEWSEDFRYCRTPNGAVLDMEELNVVMQEELDRAKDVPLPDIE